MQGILEKKITFQEKKMALALLGRNDEYIDLFCKKFSCQITSRGDEIVIRGEEDEVSKVEKIFQELMFLISQGHALTMHEVRYSIDLVLQGKEDSLHNLFNENILITAKGRQVRPKTLGQKVYLSAIKQNEITFGIGPAGTGKTYLAVAMAVSALKNKTVEKIILTRPAVEAGEKLGFLPGDLQEKVDPYLRPIYDALNDILGNETFQKFLAKGIIEVAPLAYMRGRTLENAFIILDEAQNTTPAQMKMFLTRLGFGSKIVVTGDLSQVDLPQHITSGLAEAQEVLKDVKGIRSVVLDDSDVIRHEVVARIIRAYDQYARR